MSYEVFNTIVDGRTIALDNSKEIMKRNDYWCGLLNDSALFEGYWNKTIPDLFEKKYLPFCEYTFNTPTKRSGVKGLLRSIASSLSPVEKRSFKRFCFIIRSDTEREVFLKGLRLIHKFN